MRMTPINLTTTLFFILYNCNFVLSTEETRINFQKLDPTEAGKEQKKIMVSFTADWCLPCKIIQSSLYNDPEIADIVNNNFQAVLVDVDSQLGELWNLSYNIDYLPSILFTNSSGLEFERIKRTPSKQEFLRTIMRVINTNAVPYRAHNYKDIELSHSPKSGKTIQLGAFSTLLSAKRRMHELSAYRNDDLEIIQETTSGKLLYKVVHKGLMSGEESISILKFYHKNGFEAFLRPD